MPAEGGDHSFPRTERQRWSWWHKSSGALLQHWWLQQTTQIRCVHCTRSCRRTCRVSPMHTSAPARATQHSLVGRGGACNASNPLRSGSGPSTASRATGRSVTRLHAMHATHGRGAVNMSRTGRPQQPPCANRAGVARSKGMAYHYHTRTNTQQRNGVGGGGGQFPPSAGPKLAMPTGSAAARLAGGARGTHNWVWGGPARCSAQKSESKRKQACLCRHGRQAESWAPQAPGRVRSRRRAAPGMRPLTG